MSKKSLLNTLKNEAPPFYGGLFISFLGLLVCTGWIFQSTSVVQILPHWAPMQFNTAFCFVILGFLWVGSVKNLKAFSLSLTVTLGLFSSLTLLQYVFDMNLGIDELFIDPFTVTKSHFPGRMSPMTGLSFLMLSIVGYRTLTRKGPPKGVINLPLCAFIVLITTSNLVGYLFNFESTYVWQKYTQMAAHTSLCFLIAAASKLFHILKHRKFENLYLIPVQVTLLLFLVFAYISQLVIHDQKMAIDKRMKNEAIQFAQQSAKLIDQKVLAYKRLSQRLSLLRKQNLQFWAKDTKEYMQDFGFFLNFLVLDKRDKVEWISEVEGFRHLKNFSFKDHLEFQEIKKNSKLTQAVYVSSEISFPMSRNQSQSVLFAVYPIYINNIFEGTSLAIIHPQEFFSQLTKTIELDQFLVEYVHKEKILFQSRGVTSQNNLLLQFTDNVLDWEIKVYQSEKVELSSYLGELILFLGMIVSTFFGVGIFLFRKLKKLNQFVDHKLAQKEMYNKLVSILDDVSLNKDDRLDRLLRTLLPWSSLHLNGGVFQQENGKLHCAAKYNVESTKLISLAKDVEHYSIAGFDSDSQGYIHFPILNNEELLGVLLIGPGKELNLDDYIFYEEICQALGNFLLAESLQKQRENFKNLKMLKSVVSTYNHEINNPLTIALLRAQKLQQNEELQKTYSKELNSIVNSMQRIAGIVKEISELQKNDHLDVKAYSDDSDMLVLKKSS